MPELHFGGTFNPIHHGHLIAARAVAEARGYDRVTLVPSAQPPHKPGATDIAPAADRLEMCRLATDASGLFAVDDLEIARTGPSYTIDTVRELKRRGTGQVHWLIGADMLMYLPKWRQPLDLLNEVRFVVIARPDSPIDWSALPPEFRKLEADVVPAPMIQISSTDIRRRIAGGLPIDYLTPPPVCQYIRSRGLYRPGPTA